MKDRGLWDKAFLGQEYWEAVREMKEPPQEFTVTDMRLLEADLRLRRMWRAMGLVVWFSVVADLAWKNFVK